MCAIFLIKNLISLKFNTLTLIDTDTDEIQTLTHKNYQSNCYHNNNNNNNVQSEEWKTAKDTWQTVWNYQTKTKLERSEKRKPTNTWGMGSWHHQTSVDERKKLRKNISGEPESYSRQNYVAETLSKK